MLARLYIFQDAEMNKPSKEGKLGWLFNSDLVTDLQFDHTLWISGKKTKFCMASYCWL